MKFILASASPRRSSILNEAGFKFSVIPSLCDEIIEEGLAPAEIAKSLAIQKAKSVFSKYLRPTLGADTIVVLDGVIFGKPKNRQHSIQMLTDLSGKEHKVITGFALVTKYKTIVDYDESSVLFNCLTELQIKEYTDAGSGLDKAGGYGVQDGYGLVKRVIGSFTNVVGLPIEKVELLLRGENL